MAEKRQEWKSGAGFAISAIGSAVGLGNIWRFPYMVGRYGGGAFLLIYILFLVPIGVVGLTVEWALGRSQKGGPIKAFSLMPYGKYLGLIPIIAEFLILSFYLVVFSWILSFFFASITGAVFAENFFGTISFKAPTVFFCFLAIFITSAIVMKGVQKGIEKANFVMVPLLLFSLIILAIRSITLPGAMEGIDFYLRPDFSRLNPVVFLMVVSQLFFSLTLDGGPMVVYGSYQSERRDLTFASLITAFTDCGVAVLAGFVIFPAVFAFGVEPGSGPSLIFITLPGVFHSMPYGRVFSLIFFFSLVLASFSTTVAQLEVYVDAFCTKLKWSRKKATLVGAVATFCLSAFLAVDENLYSWIEYISTVYLAIIGAIIAAIAFMWFYGSKKAREALNKGGKIQFGRWWEIIAKYIYPTVLIVIFLSSI